MSTNKPIQPDTDRVRHVVLVMHEEAHILDVAGPIEILTGTGLFVEQDAEPYSVTIVADAAGPVSTTCGISLSADKSFAQARRARTPIDILIVAGGHGTARALENTKLLDFVRWAAGRARRVVSICTGAMILAEAGLLNGRRATTHWFWCPLLSKRYPKVVVEPDALFIRDDNVWTSAGVTAGMDLALALIEEDWGHDVALQIARYNVMFMMRPGGQAQFSAQLIAQQSASGPIGDVLDYVLNNLNQNLTVTTLAAHACMSERSFARKFRQATNMTPASYVERARIQSARVALEQSDDPVETIARNVGFDKPERMRRAFQRHLGISATDYRERFQASRLARAGPK